MGRHFEQGRGTLTGTSSGVPSVVKDGGVSQNIGYGGGGRFENTSAPQTISTDLAESVRSQSLTEESEEVKEPVKTNRA